MHLHTKYSDGLNSVEEMVECAVELGLKKICFTDHVRVDSEWVNDYYNTVAALGKQYSDKLTILCGVEAKLTDFEGNLDLPEINNKIIKVAAIHRIPTGDGNYIRKNEIENNKDHSFSCWMNTIRGINKNKGIDRIAHPFSLLPYFGITPESKRFWDDIIDIFSKGSYGIEYNVKYNNDIVPKYFWECFKDRIVLASDSHSVEKFKESFIKLRKVSDELWNSVI